MTSFGDVIIPADASKHSGDIRRRHNSSSNNLLDARGKSLSSAAHVGYEFNGENNLLASDKGQFSIGLSSTVKEMMRRCLSCLSVCMSVCLSVCQSTGHKSQSYRRISMNLSPFPLHSREIQSPPHQHHHHHHHHHHHFHLLNGMTERKPIHVDKQYRRNRVTSANNSFYTSCV